MPTTDEESGRLSESLIDRGQFGNPYFRYTILFAFVLVSLTTFPIWASFVIPDTVAAINVCVILFFSFIWLWIALNAILNMSRMHSLPVIPLPNLHAARTRNFRHIVIVPCYIDPIPVLFDCLGSLLTQADLSELVVVVAFEMKTPNLDAKVAAVRTAFEGRFGHLIIPVHTVDKRSEIAGGCSNKNYALRTAYAYLKKNGLLDEHTAHTVTTCDTDSLFHPNYFETLKHMYNYSNPVLGARPKMLVWQPPLFYNWDLDERPFFNRITGLMRSMMMLGGLISFNLNPMSIFSYPMELGKEAGFINPRYGVDDIIAKVRWMCATNEMVPVTLLPVPVISGPTIGTTMWEEGTEWGRQIRRWIVGSSESFHYFIIHWRGRPMLAGIMWFFMFFMYYGVLLCSAGLFSALASIPLPWVTYPTISFGGVEVSLAMVGVLALGLQYVAFSVAFAIDRWAVRSMTVKEDIHPLRNLAHWLLAPPTLFIYSLIAFYAICRFVFAGKVMARHDMAAKEGMGAVTGASGTTTGIPADAVETSSSGETGEVPAGGELGDDIAAFYPSSSWDRKTSVDRAHAAHNHVTDMLVQHAHDSLTTSPGISLKDTTSPAVPPAPLCSMPERFYFGNYSAPVPHRDKHV